MKYQGMIKKSRTYDYATFVILLGVVEQNLPMVREQLGEYYGWVFIGVGLGIAWLRRKTTGPVGEK